MIKTKGIKNGLERYRNVYQTNAFTILPIYVNVKVHLICYISEN